MRFAPGTTATLTATISEADGDLVTPASILVDIFDPDGLKVDDGVPTLVSPGLYKFDYPLLQSYKRGLWRIDWIVDVNSEIRALGQEYFELYDEASGPPTDPDAQFNALFRSRLSEIKGDPMGNGSDTFFTDSEIELISSLFDGNLDRATLEGWKWKVAKYAKLVDITESGSDRKLSQKFKQAKDMVALWRGILKDADDGLAAALAGRVVGRAVNLRDDGCDTSNPYPFSGYSDHIRIFPSHRMMIPAILS
jgi:hypothetical protein